jgi:histidinol-phosphate aminotransferase
VNDPYNRIRPEVRAIEGYHVVAYDCPVKLNQNESPFDIPGDVKDRILEAVREQAWSRYPEPMPRDLVDAVARHLGVSADRVMVANGSNSIVQHILNAVVSPGVRVTIPSPSFSLYGQFTEILGGDPDYVSLDESFSYDIEALIQSASSGVSLVIVCSPNNPTGCDISNDDLERLLTSTDAIVVVDEAYAEFNDHTAIDLLDKHSNLIVLKTWSKAFAAAAIRVGCLIASPQLVAEIQKIKLPFDINLFSRLAAIELLQHRDTMDSNVRYIKDERNRVFQALSMVKGVTAYPSKANLILFEIDEPKRVFEALAEKGVLVRNVSGYPRLSRGLRVSIGTRKENDAFLDAFTNLMEATP